MGCKFCSLVIVFLLIASFSTLSFRFAVAADVKYESYSTAALNDFSSLDINFMAQTFNATSDHNVTDIVLWFYRLGLPGLFNVSIRETTVDGVPTSLDLADCNNTDGDAFSNVLGNPTKVVFKLSSEIILSANTEYAIVVSWPSNGDESNQLRWVEGWDSYTGGKLVQGAANGEDWDEGDFGDDAYFEIWDIEIQYSLKMITVGNGDVSPGNQTYVSGTNININATNSAGWSFTGWSGDASGNANTTIVMDGNKTVTATFTQNTIPEMPSNAMMLLLIAMTLGIALVVKKRSLLNHND
jgi:uncharacterized repeat protein (TIGR02543 family)